MDPNAPHSALTPEDIRMVSPALAKYTTAASEVLTHLAFYAGWPNAMSAVPVVKGVFEKRQG